jgi:HSP20 family protein
MADITVQKKSQTEAPAAVARRQWDPFRVAREMLGWDPFQDGRPLLSGDIAAYAPAFDVKETKDAFVFKADVPGVKEEDLEITTTGNRLSISGKREEEKEDKQGKQDTYYAYERSFGSFTRTFTLPDEADVAHIKAELKNGEVTVVIPKAPAAVAKRIPVAAGDRPKG